MDRDLPSSGSASKELERQLTLLPLLVSLSKHARALWNVKLAPAGLMGGQDDILACLPEGECLPIDKLASAVRSRSSTISRSIDRLAERGLVVRKSDPGDKRRTLIEATPAGLEKRAEAMDVLVRLDDELTEAFASKDLLDTMSSLKMIDEVLIARLSRLR